jgi:hypothetical protein
MSANKTAEITNPLSEVMTLASAATLAANSISAAVKS